jgi:hypothetical protein
MIFMCMEGSLRDVSLFHPKLVVAKTKVKFSEKLGSMNFIQEVINNWDRKKKFDGQLIESLEIGTSSPNTFLL